MTEIASFLSVYRHSIHPAHLLIMRTPRIFLLASLVGVLLLTACDSTDPSSPDASTPLTDETALPAELPSVPEVMALLDSVAQTSDFSKAFAEPKSRRPGTVYTMTNDPDDNEIIVFRRTQNGELNRAGSFATDGRGSGDGLNGTSNPLIVSDDDRYLFAVNGGSDEVVSFQIRGASLRLVSRVQSGGFRPISVTSHGTIVYVLNAGRDGLPGLITGFRVERNGHLVPLPDARLPLNPGAGNPSQIDFNPDGTVLVITDKPTNEITTYRVGADGVAGPPQPQPSNGMTPFGFDFARDLLLVSEAAGGAEDASSLSSYRLDATGALTLISGSVPTTESAACWVEATENGRYAYVTNTGSGTISGYRIGSDGSLTLLDDDGVTAETGGGPLDMEMVGSEFLYVHVGGTNEILSYRVEPGTGALLPLDNRGTRSLPATAVGMAVTGASSNRTDLGGTRFVALMTGDQQVPTPVETSAGGITGFRVNQAGTALLYVIALADIDEVTQAHTHLAPRGENGPVTAFLLRFTENVDGSGSGEPFIPEGLFLEFGLITADDVVGPIEGDFRALVESMIADGAYVNVHTVSNPPGEIRGQISDIAGFLP